MSNEWLVEGLEVNFSKICPALIANPLDRLIGFVFAKGDPAILASEIPCPNGGLPGVEKRTDSGSIMPISHDRILAYCKGCTACPHGFIETIE